MGQYHFILKILCLKPIEYLGYLLTLILKNGHIQMVSYLNFRNNSFSLYKNKMSKRKLNRKQKVSEENDKVPTDAKKRNLKIFYKMPNRSRDSFLKICKKKPTKIFDQKKFSQSGNNI